MNTSNTKTVAKTPLAFTVGFLFALAALAPTSAQSQVRTQSQTWHPSGLLAIVDGPRIDVADITSYSYDTAGRLVSVVNALGHTTTLSNHDPWGRAQTVVDANGVTTRLGYNEQGQLISSRIDGADSITLINYDPAGLISRITQADGSFTQYTWDAARRLTLISNALGERIEYDYNALSQRTAQRIKSPTGAIERQQQWTHDALGRLIQSIGAAGQTSSYGYDLNSNLTARTDQRQNSHSQAFDALDRLIASTGPLGHSSALGYNAQNQPTQATGPGNVTTTYSYDAVGNAIQQSSPDSGISTYQYDAAGNVTQSVDARGITTRYQYDALNRITARQHGAGTGTTTGSATSAALNNQFSYDNTQGGNRGIGKLTGMQDASGTTRWRYDGQGRLVQTSRDIAIAGSATTTRNETIGWRYDSAGRISQTRLPDSISLHYARDMAGRVASIGYRAGSANNPIIPIASGISHNAFGAVSSLTWGNGLSMSRAYDLDGRLVQQNAGSWQLALGYDASGNITSQQSSGLPGSTTPGSASYTYDALDRLTQSQAAAGAQQDSYSYDTASNRLSWQSTDGANGTATTTTSTNYSYTPGSNRLSSIDAQPVTTDAAGNLTQDRANRLLSYDSAGRLSSVSLAGSIQAESTYNALGQRTHKSTPGGSTTTYLYDAEGQLLGQTIYAFGIVRLQSQYFVWLEDSDMPIAILQVRYDSTTGETITTAASATNPQGLQVLYLHTDQLQTPRVATNQSQQIIWQWNTAADSSGNGDAFGANPAITDPDGDGVNTRIDLRFAGQVFDEETGLHYNYFRDYDPQTGRYLQSDPIGLNGGWNTFGYVEGNPLGYKDPLGLNATGAVGAVLPPLAIRCALTPGCMAKVVNICQRGFRNIKDWVLSEGTDNEKKEPNVRDNNRKGKDYEEEIAKDLESSGREVDRQVGKETPFGPRTIDLEVRDKDGNVLGGIEVKAGNGRYRQDQRSKDEWLRQNGYPVDVVRQR